MFCEMGRRGLTWISESGGQIAGGEGEVAHDKCEDDVDDGKDHDGGCLEGKNL